MASPPPRGAASDLPARLRSLPHGRGETPTERLFTHDLRELAPGELLSILLEPGLGRVRAEAAALHLLCVFAEGGQAGSLGRMGRASPTELCAAGRLTRAAAARLAAALELGRRYAEEPAAERIRITAARTVFERFRPRLGERGDTELWVLVLGARNALIREVRIALSPGAARLMHPREVLRPAIVEAARGLVLVQNDPSGSRLPASVHHARPMTARISAAAATVGLELWDHVVVRRDGYLSFREAGLLTDAAASKPRRSERPAVAAEPGARR